MNAPSPCPMKPVPARVLSARKESREVVTLTLEASSSRDRPFQPGQFNMLYVFGVGEVPVSMSGSPARPDVLVHTVKAVGAVTDALCRLRRNGVVGVRGPFGAPWPSAQQLAGADLLMVAGGLGLAPLRPAIYRALQRRCGHGRLTLLVGARTPEDLLFRSELERWRRRDDVTVLVTVDRASTDWSGRVGVVPALLSEVELCPERTVAFVCGPELMMRFTLRELSRRGISDERIYLSMERNMKCAVGSCGHCQFGPNFVCLNGPVLRYDLIRPLFWRREV